MQFQKAYAHLIQLLQTQMPAHAHYHNAGHTKYVLQIAEHLAAEEGVSDTDLILLKTAALYHDAGYLQQHNDHEKISCQLAREQLPGFEYTPQQIDTICSLIMATQIPQQPTTLLQKILCDADLYYLGTNAYHEYSENLYLEYKHLHLVSNRREWLIKEIEFLSNHQFFTQTALKENEAKKQTTLSHLKAKLAAPAHKQAGHSRLNWVKDIVLNIAGILIAAFALKYFLVPNHFFDGGITGLSLLLHELYHLNLSMLIIVLNLPLIVLSYFANGKAFALRIMVSIFLFGVCLLLLPDYAITNDKLLIAAFGGIFLGIGIGLVMRAGAALDGIEVLALYTFKRTSYTITEIILAINIVIFGIAAFKFGIETSLYSVLTYLAATRTIDYVVEGIRAFTGVTIISGKSEAIKYELVNSMGRGITVYKGERGFLPGQYEVSSECDIIFTVITRLELRKLKNLVHKVDPKAFVYASTIRDTAGGILSRSASH